MTKTQIIKLKGKASWAKVFEDNRDMKGFEGAAEEYGGQYTIDVSMDKENFDKLKESGSMLTGRVGEDGQIVKFKRKHIDRFPETSGPPIVEKNDGTIWDFETDGAIGNGSEVEVTLEVYKTSRARIVGTRLRKVVVLDPVSFDDTKSHVIKVHNEWGGEIPF